jgi:hypothetical protein
MKKLVAAGALLAALVPLGCSGDPEASTLPGQRTSSATAGPSTGTAASSTPPTTAPASPPAGPPSKVVGVHRRNVVATTAEQQAVADALLRYLEVRLVAFNKAAVDLNQLRGVASGRALSVVTGRVAQLRAKKQHTIGEVWVDIRKVTVTGTTSTTLGCMDNTTIDVDTSGRAVEMPVPYYTVTGALEKAGGTAWLVKSINIADQRCQ